LAWRPRNDEVPSLLPHGSVAASVIDPVQEEIGACRAMDQPCLSIQTFFTSCRAN